MFINLKLWANNREQSKREPVIFIYEFATTCLFNRFNNFCQMILREDFLALKEGVLLHFPAKSEIQRVF